VLASGGSSPHEVQVERDWNTRILACDMAYYEQVRARRSKLLKGNKDCPTASMPALRQDIEEVYRLYKQGRISYDEHAARTSRRFESASPEEHQAHRAWESAIGDCYLAMLARKARRQ
jgi:hypothetical protein